MLFKAPHREFLIGNLLVLIDNPLVGRGFLIDNLLVKREFLIDNLLVLLAEVTPASYIPGVETRPDHALQGASMAAIPAKMRRRLHGPPGRDSEVCQPFCVVCQPLFVPHVRP